MPIIPPDYGTGSSYYSQNFDNIQELLQRIYDNANNVIVAKDVRDPLWTLWNKISGLSSSLGSASTLYTLGTPSSISVGGILEGSTFSNATLTQLFDQMLLPYVAPVVDNFGPSVSDKQFGDTTGINLTYSINVGSVTLDGSYAIQFVSPNPSSLIPNKAVTGNDPETGTTNNFSLTYSTATISVVSYAVATMSFRTTDLTIFTATTSIAQKHKRYYGQITIPGGFTPSSPTSILAVGSYLTDNTIKGLSYSELSTNVNFSQAVDFSASGQYFVFAAPTVFGFNYPIGFYIDNIFTQNYTKVRSNSNLSNEFGFVVPYDVYIINDNFIDGALISTIPLPSNYISNNFSNVINSVIVGDQGPIGPTGPTGPSISPGGFTWSFQLNDGSNGLTGIGYFDFINGSININQVSQTSSNSTVIGIQSGSQNTGCCNTFLGWSSGMTNSTGSKNTFIGSNSGKSNLTGTNNTFIGSDSGVMGTTSSFNVFLGSCAGLTNSSGSCGVFIGYLSGLSNTTASHNTFIGSESGRSNTIGGCNIFIGSESGKSNTIGCCNVFIGNKSGLCNISACDGVFLGDGSGSKNTTGCGNVFIGRDSGCSNTTGCFNISIGWLAGCSFTQSSNNIFIGNNAGRYTTTGVGILIGNRAGECSSGQGNVLIGAAIGVNLPFTSCNNVFLGNCSGPTVSATYSHSIAIGHCARITSSCQLSIGSLTSPIGTSSTVGSISEYLCLTINGVDRKLALYSI